PHRGGAAGSGGRAFGYRPVEDGATLTTAPTPDAISSSAAIRSMSVWSMMATSAGPGRFTRRLVGRAGGRPAGQINRERGRGVWPSLRALRRRQQLPRVAAGGLVLEVRPEHAAD